MNNATDEDYLRNEAQKDMASETKWELATGCWIDDRWGQYGITRLIQIAQDYGFVLDDCEQAAVYAYRKDQTTFKHCGLESYVDDWLLNQGGIADTAEEWMNENVAKDGFSFGWSNGEFFYMNTEWWEES